MSNAMTSTNTIQYSHDGKNVTIQVVLESPEAQDSFCMLPSWVKFDSDNRDMRGKLVFDGASIDQKVNALRDCVMIENSMSLQGIKIENQLASAIESGKQKAFL